MDRKLEIADRNGTKAVLADKRPVQLEAQGNFLPKKTKEYLEKKTKEQRLLLDTIDTQVWYLTDCETYGRVNQAHADFLGLDVKAVAHKRLEEFVSKEVAEVCRNSNMEVFKSRKPVHTEEWVPNAGGEKRLLAITKTPKLDADGNVEYVVCAGTDITEKRHAEEALREQRDFSESLIETAQAIILVLDTKGRIVRFNHYMEELIGYRLDEVKGKNWFETFLKPEDGKAVAALFQKALSDNQTRGNVNSIIARNGRQILVEWHDKTLKDRTGRTLGLLAVGQDITERVRMQQRLQRLEKHESLERMAGAVAHLFSNQLSVVIGNLDLLAEDLPQGSTASENLREAQRAANRAAETSGLMLTFLGHSRGRPVPVDLARACRERLALLEEEKPSGTEIISTIPDSGPIVRIDRLHLDQVVSALVTNAWESLDKDGQVRVAVSTIRAADIPESHRLPLDWEPISESYACLEVADTGCGMDETTIGRIFDPFFTEKFTGRGLGLPVVSGILKASDGCVAVQSRPAGGSVFRVFWPILQKAVHFPADGGPAGFGPSKKHGLILLVEDHPMARSIAKAMLNHLGYEVLTAEDGEEAVKLFSKNPEKIQLVLTDLTMPRFNGWDTLKALRRIQADIPVILASGYDEEFALLQSQGEKPQAFLSKPYHMNDLKRALQVALGRMRKA